MPRGQCEPPLKILHSTTPKKLFIALKFESSYELCDFDVSWESLHIYADNTDTIIGGFFLDVVLCNIYKRYATTGRGAFLLFLLGC